MTIRTHQSTFGISVIQIILLQLLMISITVVSSLSTGASLIQTLSLVPEKTIEPSSPILKQENRFLNSQLKPSTPMSNGVITCQGRSVPWILMAQVQSYHSLQKVYSLTQRGNLLLLIFQPPQTRLTCQNGNSPELVHLLASETNLYHSIKSLKDWLQFITVAQTWTLLKECKSLTTNSKASQQPKSVIKRAKALQTITT
jgi:hypothetical protein